MNVRILEDQEGTVPFRIGIWTPRGNHGVFLVFQGGRLVFQTVATNQVLRAANIGRYTVGKQYRLEMSLDKEAGTIASRLVNVPEAPPGGGRALRVIGRAIPQWHSHIYSALVPVDGGKDYFFGGMVKLVDGPGLYGLAVEWLDRSKARLKQSSEWHHVEELSGWTKGAYVESAPLQAAFARLVVASAPGTDLLFSNMYFREKENSQNNLLSNGDFRTEAKGWERASADQIPLEFLDDSRVDYQSTVSHKELPQLFDELRLTLSMGASSTAGVSRAVSNDFVLTIPHQRWLIVRTDDARGRMLVSVLLGLGVSLCAGRLALRIWSRPRQWTRNSLAERVQFPAVSALIAGAIAYCGLNSLLFNPGSLNYDLMAGTVWGYISTYYGLSELYQRTVITQIAEAWGGLPLQEAAFPYLPGMAYVFLAVGWIYRLFLAAPGPMARNAFELALVIRTFNALFAYASAILIYLVLQQQRVSPRWSLVAGGFFLLNPAVWFVGSVWGQTQSWSIFFLLLAIWLGEKKYALPAWMALAVTALTRQQMLVPASLLGLVFLQRFSFRQNLRAVVWTVIAVFLLAAPLLLSIGPSAIADFFYRTLGLQLAVLNDQWATLVSWGALSVWPLITLIVNRQTGLNRMLYSSREPLFGEVAYWQLGNLLFLGVFAAAAAVLALRRRPVTLAHSYVPAIALGMMGLLMLKTGFSALHFLPALALVILSKKSMNGFAYCASTAILTATILIPMYSIAAVWLTYHPSLSVGLFDPANRVTEFFKGFLMRDWFITVGSIANLMVLLWLAISATRPVASSPPPQL